MRKKPCSLAIRAVSAALAVVMLFSFSPLTAFAEEETVPVSSSSEPAPASDSGNELADETDTEELKSELPASESDLESEQETPSEEKPDSPSSEPASSETTGQEPADDTPADAPAEESVQPAMQPAMLTVQPMTLDELANVTQSPGNTTYYVDAENGSDTNNGLSESSAWQTLDKVNSMTFAAGDVICLRSGCTWNGALKPQGSGADGNPIKITSYGDGARPVINGGGTSGPTLTGAVQLYNQEYWEIENLEVTNLEPTDQPGDVMDGGTSERAGILVYSSIQDRVLNYIRIRNCYVHDVNSDWSGGKTSGGIIVIGNYMDMDGTVVTVDDAGNPTPHAMGRAAFSDVIIENNYVKNVAIEGIRNKCNTNINSSGWGKNEFLKNFSNVIIRNNYIEDVVGDGIVLTEVKGGSVEGNIVKNSCGFDRGNVNYAQCWTMFADDVVVQYNEVYGNRYGYDDGEAFDSDMKNERNVFQYNLSHDNGGGACLFMSSQTDTVFRYNVSINDGAGTYPNGSKMRQQVFHYDSTSSDGPNVPEIYNNTFYISGADNSTVLFGGKSARTCFVNFKNNIVLAEDGAEVTFTHDDSEIHADSIIENNCLYPESIGTSSGKTADELTAVGNLFADPQLNDPSAGLTYTQFGLSVDEMDKLSTLAKERVVELSRAYELTENSPCIRAGQIIDGAPETDLFGNPVVGLVDIGAHEYSNTPETNGKVTDVTVHTLAGRAPELPATVDVELDGRTYAFPVVWDEIPDGALDQEGSFELSGTVTGVAEEAKATVYVVTTPVGDIVADPVTTHAGTYPELPSTVSVNFGQGIAIDLPVTWEIMTSEQFTKAGTYTLHGAIEGLEAEAAIEVTVTGKVSGEAEELTQFVSEDAYVQESPATTNYDGKRLEVKLASPGYHRRTLLKFDLSGLTEDAISSAQKIELRLYGAWAQEDVKWNTGTGDDTTRWVNLYAVDSGWSEKTVSWNTAPDPDNGALLVQELPLVNRDINQKNFTIDITEYVRENGADELSLMLGIFSYGEYGDADNNGFAVASKETAESDDQKPALILSYAYLTNFVPVNVTVAQGLQAELPETVTAVYSDGTQEERAVTWDAFDTTSCSEGETVTVRGAVAGTSMPVEAVITIEAPQPEIIGVEELAPIRVRLGTAEDKLGLPETVTVQLDNGETTEVPVNYWFPEPAYDPYVEQSYTWVGYLDVTGTGVGNTADHHASIQTILFWPPNKNILTEAVAAADEAERSGEVQASIASVRTRFAAAHADAQSVLADQNATIDDVQQAYNEMQTSLWMLGYRMADKTVLQELVTRADGLDLSLYTETSVLSLREALDSVRTVLDNGELSTADQSIVDEAVQALKAAMLGLEPIQTDSGPSGGSSEGSSGGSSAGVSAQTGDTTPVAALVLVMVLAAACIVVGIVWIIRRKHK